MLARLPTRIPTLRASIQIQRKQQFATMPTSDPEVKNASGLTPTQTKALKERNPEDHERSIIQSIKEVSLPGFRYANFPDIVQLYTSSPKEVSSMTKLGHLTCLLSL